MAATVAKGLILVECLRAEHPDLFTTEQFLNWVLKERDRLHTMAAEDRTADICAGIAEMMLSHKASEA